MNYFYSIVLLVLFSQTHAFAQQTTIGGTKVDASKNIIDNLLNSSDHFAFIGILKAAGMIETLRQAGPYTLFAPTDAAFDQLPQEKMNQLMDPANRSKLKSFVNSHIAKGSITLEKGATGFSTLSGDKLTTHSESSSLTLSSSGASIKIINADVRVKNGIIQVLDSVIIP